ncbi:Na+/H+ antiporter subunit E [Marisediminicola sp. LYQ134]|uniref:Na+/H+ antiporter subunit E n=1 Tax=Marisediminicola sp. LYQ134 TaxID=3391061 RepID=UPI0039835754
MTDGQTRVERRASLREQLPLLVVLVALWMLLWGSVSWLNLVTGIVLALVVTRVFYLPPVELSGRFNVLWFVWYLARFLVELVGASFQIALKAFDLKGVRGNAVIGVNLRTRSDFILTLTAINLSLIPGSLVVETDRERSVLYLHVFNTKSAADADAMHGRALEIEERLVRIFGSKVDVERICS